jgi:alcohol dehydrogenase, propanol-preferring
VTAQRMRAWVVDRPAPAAESPLRLVTRDTPEPGPGEILVRVTACGVCRTDLHVAEGDLPLPRPGIVPGHEVVGRVVDVGAATERFGPGARVGIAWLRHTCGRCRACTSGRENLCPQARFTGWDADGGYAEYAVVDERYAYAPLLCAGIIGYRALRRTALPSGGRLGIYGFGGSAHLAAQVAVHEGAAVHVLTRSPAAKRLALDLGAASASDPAAQPPEPLDAAVIFAPAGELVPVALEALDAGGVLVLAGIHLSAIPPLDYRRHLYGERELRSVTANTRTDGAELLAHAARIPLEVATTPFAFEQADEALRALASGRMRGAGVLLLDA